VCPSSILFQTKGFNRDSRATGGSIRHIAGTCGGTVTGVLVAMYWIARTRAGHRTVQKPTVEKFPKFIARKG
jgi:hypothetical protein